MVYAFTSGAHMKGVVMTVLCLRQASCSLISRRTTTFSPARPSLVPSVPIE
ncbi:hypothetical protein PF002_g3718 [Phytophthora fragariae]|uniref:Uncharacterized protein n=1 Tax=Phytophthora fragariae TaxID=53985 RepID=A0A6A3T9N7_9STRA|nr:hypothetical protein PF003_g35078 [Phytophthora fragariae]KAE9132597.1 hypothetical protein PF007_g3665 [Phytophthora fragariae]KAE9152849.1 hypothetical protein PF006_g2956 [Phytophthora fragariae]KAE9251247.1 hypothetical protein PF004_g2578 [Phytophthora fragariae]KAE9252643.1 hypothetical protein PF002_g3718 [Phytophthora fragariae]